MRAPEFWDRADSPSSPILTPLAALWTWGARWRAQKRGAHRVPVPVICAGGVVVGGSGKTPVVQALADRLHGTDIEVHLLGRGYKGRFKGPLRVDPARHTAREVGDEALLLARVAPTWIARNRPLGADAAVRSGARGVILDDGFQDPSLHKDLSLLVIDGDGGLGNGRVIPAGPLREPVEDAFQRADAVVVVGEDTQGVADLRPENMPLLHASILPAEDTEKLQGRRVFAFAGIARPERFFCTLKKVGAEIVDMRSFPDHFRFRKRDVVRMLEEARQADAVAVTTEKDIVRVPAELASQIVVAGGRLRFENPEVLDSLLESTFSTPQMSA